MNAAARLDASEAIADLRRLLGPDLFALAVVWSRSAMPSASSAAAAIRASGALVDRRLTASLALEVSLATADLLREARRLKTCRYASFRKGRYADRYRLPSGTPASRLYANRRAEIELAASTLLRRFARQETTQLVFVARPEDCLARLVKDQGWIRYGSAGRRFGVLSARYEIAAMATCPLPRGLGGRLILAAVAEPESGPASGGWYRAVWAVRTCEGCATEAGYVHVKSGVAKFLTEEAAERLLQRLRAEETRPRPSRRDSTAQALDELSLG